MSDFYRSICGIPVAGATLPVCAFFLLGIYGSNVFLLVAVIILGIGHIGIHLQHRNEMLRKQKSKLPIRILKCIGGIAGVVLIAVSIFVIGCRNVNYINHYRMIEHGVDEEAYVTLGSQEQYVLMRGMNNDNPVIIYLHGGPSSPDTYATYGFTDYLIDEYTIVAWDQRGCGRTYFHNIENDSENTTASFEQAKADLDELVDYAMDIYGYEDAFQKAMDVGDNTSELVDAFETFQTSDDLMDMMRLRSLTSKYHPVSVSDKATWMAVTSPYFGMNDFRWFLKQLGDMNEYFTLNQQLFDYTFTFDAYANGLEYEMPVYLISGTCDWVCPVDSIQEYAEDISAPDVRMELIEDCGHNLQYSSPEEFADMVKEVLKD